MMPADVFEEEQSEIMVANISGRVGEIPISITLLSGLYRYLAVLHHLEEHACMCVCVSGEDMPKAMATMANINSVVTTATIISVVTMATINSVVLQQPSTL